MAKKNVDNVVTDENPVETTDNSTLQEERKQQIINKLIEPVEDNITGEERKTVPEESITTPITTPSTVNSFDKGTVVGGAFGRRRIGARKEVPKKDPSSRRGVFKIWEDQPVRNVGEGTHTYTVKDKRNS